jgi:PhnB protein
VTSIWPQLSVRRGREAVAAGARQIYPAAEAHGWLLGRIDDPYGHHWEVGRPLAPWPPRR